MPHESVRIIIDKQLSRLIELNILDSESSNSSDNDLEMLDLLSTDDESGSLSGDSDRDPDIFDESDSEDDDEIDDLAVLMDVVEQSRYLTRSEKWEKSSEFLQKYFLDRFLEFGTIAHSRSHEHCTTYQTAKEQHKDGFLRCKSLHMMYAVIASPSTLRIWDLIGVNMQNLGVQCMAAEAKAQWDSLAWRYLLISAHCHVCGEDIFSKTVEERIWSGLPTVFPKSGYDDIKAF
ncbi:hypothetical protein R1sor_026353 [Riccia sorocarpa]|uniref:Transposase n=1 Tax=Riccia sorocarpa TaxID=122646 RepID=A0ABD3GEF1_9MARC